MALTDQPGYRPTQVRLLGKRFLALRRRGCWRVLHTARPVLLSARSGLRRAKRL